SDVTLTVADVAENSPSDTIVVGHFKDKDPHGALDDYTATSSDPNFTAQIIQEGNHFAVAISGSFHEEGSTNITVTVRDHDASVTFNHTINVGDAPLSPGAATPVCGSEGEPLRDGGEEEDPPDMVVAQFTDGDSQPATYAVTIYWGDGTSSPGWVEEGGVEGSHTYKEAGTYAIQARVTDEGGASVLLENVASIAE